MSATADSIVFFDIDTQVDFMEPTGALYVPEAEQAAYAALAELKAEQATECLAAYSGAERVLVAA